MKKLLSLALLFVSFSSFVNPAIAKDDSEVIREIKEHLVQKGQDLYGISNPSKELVFRLIDNGSDFPERRLVIFYQIFEGVPVAFGQISFEYSLDQGMLRVGNNLVPTNKIASVNVTPSIKSEEAIERAKRSLGLSDEVQTYSSPVMQVLKPNQFPSQGDKPRLIWMIRFKDSKHMIVYLDAHDGSVVLKYSNIQT